MIDWNETEVKKRIEENQVLILYAYTPLCGTCQLASKMLTVVETLLPSLPIGKINLNYGHAIAIEQEIESVPCLLIFQHGRLLKKIYAFQSVEYLYYQLKPLLSLNEQQNPATKIQGEEYMQ